jgi:hypothetical protein
MTELSDDELLPLIADASAELNHRWKIRKPIGRTPTTQS